MDVIVIAEAQVSPSLDILASAPQQTVTARKHDWPQGPVTGRSSIRKRAAAWLLFNIQTLCIPTDMARWLCFW